MRLKINKKLISLFTAGALTMCTGCGKANAKDISLDEIFANDQVKAITTIDEEVKTKDLMYDDVFSILDKAEQLEEAIEIFDILEDTDYKDVDLLKDLETNEKDEALEADIKEIKKLKKQSEDTAKDLLTIENRLIAIKKLALIKKNNHDFIRNEGITIAKDFIKTAVKGSVAAEANTKIDKIKIGSYKGKDIESISITINGDEYKVKPSNKKMWNGIDYEYVIEMSDFKNASDKEIVDTCRKAINYSKDIILSGSNIEDNEIVKQYSDSYIKEKILQK